jgi:hypothetical protein
MNPEMNVCCSQAVNNRFVRSYSVLKKCNWIWLRRLSFFHGSQPVMGQGVMIVETSISHTHTHTHTHTTVGRAPLDKWSALSTDLFATTQYPQQTDIPTAGGIGIHNPCKRAATAQTLECYQDILQFIRCYFIQVGWEFSVAWLAACYGGTTSWRVQHHVYNSNITQKTASLWPAVASLLRSCSLGIIILLPNSKFVVRYTNRNIEIHSVWVNVVHVHTFDKLSDKIVLTFYIRWRSAIL